MTEPTSRNGHASTNGHSAVRLIQRRPEANGQGPIKGAGWPERKRKWKPRERLADPYWMKHVVPKNRWRDLRTGFTAAHDFIWRRTEVTAMEKALWLHSCRVAWDTGIYWESRGGAREALGFTKGQIHDTRRRLIELGLWELDRVRDDGVRFYRIMAPHDWTPG